MKRAAHGVASRHARPYSLAIALFLGFIGWARPQATAQQNTGLEPRSTAGKQVAALSSQVNAEPVRLVVKFNEGTGVRVQNGQINATSAGALSAAAGVRSRAQLDAELSRAQGELARRGLQFGRMFSLADDRLAALRQRGESRSRRQLADLRLYFQIPAERFSSVAEMEQVRDLLNQLDSVEVAYIEPASEPAQLEDVPDVSTPDFSAQQGYKDPAPMGIDGAYAATFAGGLGAGVAVIDVELGWNVEHEDFPRVAYSLGDNTTADDNHGTAVVGVIAAPINGFGISGITPDVDMGYSSVYGAANGGGAAGAILSAADVLGAGDVLLIELHRAGPNTVACTCNSPQCNYLPLEFWPADFDAIATATANGILVVEAAGNGSVDMEHPAYGGLLSRNTRDSGAIVVGASESSSRNPMCWSNHGSRVDVHGWGQHVVTLGGGDLYAGALGKNDLYTKSFSGTSSASPIVTGAAAAIQGVALASRGAPLAPAEVRGLLRATGTPQNAGVQRAIGPLPDLRAALDSLNSGASVPFASFTVTCDERGSCTYQDTSRDLFGRVVSWQWTFDDGTTSTAENPVHTYGSFGSHLATLTVTDGDGNTDTTYGTTSIEDELCSDSQVVLSEDFESGFGEFTTSGSVSRITGAAHSGSYGARVRGTGTLRAILDVRGFQDLNFSGWARAISYDPGEVLYFEFCPWVNGQCDAARSYYQEVPVGQAGSDAYSFYEVTPYTDLAGIDEVQVTIGTNASSSFEYAYFDDIEANGRRCQSVECLNDTFCDNQVYCDGAETCVAGSCEAGAPPCSTGSCSEATQSCEGGGGGCGDGVVGGGEGCDDGNTSSCDGCSATCAVEACGNGALECDEQCDDGNLIEGDGCSSACAMESSDCMSAVATLDEHVAAGRAYPESTQDCSACWFGCTWPSGCATSVTTYSAIGSDERLGSEGGTPITLYSDSDGASWSTIDCQGGTCITDADCNDGMFCNGTETCAGGACVAGSPVTCSDGISCTADLCNEVTDTCEPVADDRACDDGDSCTLDICQIGTGCQNAVDPQCAVCTENGTRCTYDGECCSGDCGWFTRTCR